MNIFVLHKQAKLAAKYHCDKHVPKMIVETAQMLGSALRRHGAQDDDMPLTQSGQPFKGGYHRHPCTVWAGDSLANFFWLYELGHQLCQEYWDRFDKHHFCEDHIKTFGDLAPRFSGLKKYVPRSSFAVCMADEFKVYSQGIVNPVASYRNYYVKDKPFAKWDRSFRGQPAWFTAMQSTGGCLALDDLR